MWYPISKRLFDIVFAALGLLVLFPCFAIVALLIKLTDRGPVLYRQTRIGRFGKPFQIWKFRTMIVNAHEFGPLITNERDPRITFVGRILRKTKIDELPQLWNVLKGEMSFVGPRPQVPRFINKLTEAQREMLKHRPGITDLATLKFRDEEELLSGADDVDDFYIRHCLPRKIALNLQYSRQASLHHDVWIILQTLCPYWFAVLVVYLVSLTLGFWLCYEIRSDFNPTPAYRLQFRRCLPWMLLPQLVLLMWRGQLRGLLSYFSIPEIKRLLTALAGALIVQLGLQYASPPLMPPRGLIVMNFVLSFWTVCAIRMVMRFVREYASRPHPQRPSLVKRVGIIGTGELATNLVLDFSRSGNPSRRVVAMFDDDPLNWRKRPHDIPVVGMPECLLSSDWQKRLDEVIITLPSERSERIQQIGEMLKRSPIKVTIASGWPELTTFPNGHS